MVDAKRYMRLKPKGVTEIIKDNGVFYLTFKRFDNEDGSEVLPPEEQEIIFKELEDRKQAILLELSGIEAILDEVYQLNQ